MAEHHEKKKRTLWERLTSPYRLVLLNDETFEEVTSFRLTRMNVYVLASTLFVILVAITVSAIVYTPLKQYIPGYADPTLRRNNIALNMQADSMLAELQASSNYMQNLNRIISGEIPTGALYDTSSSAPVKYDSINLDRISSSEKELRDQMEEEERYRVSAGSRLSTSPSSSRCGATAGTCGVR